MVGSATKKISLQKISVLETDNYLISPTFNRYNFDDKSYADLVALREYVEKKVSFRSKEDPQIIIEALQWVSTQWDHDGRNQPPKDFSSLEILKSVHEKGDRYRCVEYGKVLADLLRSLGYVARHVGLKSVDVAYGGFGQGHVATEVWSNKLRSFATATNY